MSLLELTILMGILAAAAVSLLTWLTPEGIEESKRLQLTLYRLNKIEAALEAFRAENDRLPCPARRDLADDNANAGLEDCTGVDATVENAQETAGNVHADCENVFDATPRNIGVLPVRSLGLEMEFMTDGWDRRFTYHVSESVCPTGGCTAATYANNDGDIEVRGYNDDTGDPDPYVQLATNAAYVVFSHGRNGNCAWMPSGMQRGHESETDESWIEPVITANADAAANLTSEGEAENIYMKPNATARITYWQEDYSADFDDMLVYKTKSQIEYRVSDANPQMTRADCQTLTTTLGNVTPDDVGTHMTNAWAATPERTFAVMWYMQEICAEYYPDMYDANGVDANGAAQDPDERKCGTDTGGAGIGREWDINDGGQPYCDCPSGNPAWNGGAGECT